MKGQRGSGQEAGDRQGVWGHRSASGGREWSTVSGALRGHLRCGDGEPSRGFGSIVHLSETAPRSGRGKMGMLPTSSPHPTPPPSPAHPAPSSSVQSHVCPISTRAIRRAGI